MTTEHFNKLADAIDPAKLTPDSDDTALRREAARILRAACAADVGGLMRQAQVFADAYTEWANYPTNRLEAQHDAARAALESALRVALAPKAGFVMVPVEPTEAMLEAAHNSDREYTLRNFGDIMTVMQGPYDHWCSMIAAAQPGAQEQAK